MPGTRTWTADSRKLELLGDQKIVRVIESWSFQEMGLKQ